MIKLPLTIQDPLDPKISNAIVDHLGIDDVHGPHSFSRDEAVTQLSRMYKAFLDLDCTLLEVNPWAFVRSHDSQDLFMTLMNVKMTIDDNALYRQPEIIKLRGVIDAKMGIQVDYGEIAAKMGLNYVKVNPEGNIACMSNGAGLAMATMDHVNIMEGTPSVFMDISERVDLDDIDFGFQLLATDPNLDVIFVNVFGGMIDCEKVASGIIRAVQRIEDDKKRDLSKRQNPMMEERRIGYQNLTFFRFDPDRPLPAIVVRLNGNFAELGTDHLLNYFQSRPSVDFVLCADLNEATEIVVKKAKLRKSEQKKQPKGFI